MSLNIRVWVHLHVWLCSISNKKDYGFSGAGDGMQVVHKRNGSILMVMGSLQSPEFLKIRFECDQRPSSQLCVTTAYPHYTLKQQKQSLYG